MRAAEASSAMVAGVIRPCATFRINERAGHPVLAIRAPRAALRRGRA
jgi:hypothetical protein